jgi:glycosyltransferase involved in cell wall biosynthesis
VRRYLERAAVFVAPLRIGGGFPNKVAEALAAGAPVVATPSARAGITHIETGKHLLEADGENDFAGAIVRILEDPDLGVALGAAGRELMSARYGWSHAVTRLEAVHSEAVAARA